jgi:hypothetical protein
VAKFYRHDFKGNEAMMNLLSHFVCNTAACGEEIGVFHSALMKILAYEV